MTNDDDKRDALHWESQCLVKLMGLLKSNRVGDKSGVNTKSHLSATRVAFAVLPLLGRDDGGGEVNKSAILRGFRD